MEKDPVLCDRCSGTGKYTGKFYCDRCFGSTGKIPTGGYPFAIADAIGAFEICDKCNGTGFYSDTVDCFLCNGTGWRNL